MNIYEENGYENRTEYLKALAFDYDIDMDKVHALAYMLGPDEDFDALICFIEDYLHMSPVINFNYI